VLTPEHPSWSSIRSTIGGPIRRCPASVWSSATSSGSARIAGTALPVAANLLRLAAERDSNRGRHRPDEPLRRLRNCSPSGAVGVDGGCRRSPFHCQSPCRYTPPSSARYCEPSRSWYQCPCRPWYHWSPCWVAFHCALLPCRCHCPCCPWYHSSPSALSIPGASTKQPIRIKTAAKVFAFIASPSRAVTSTPLNLRPIGTEVEPKHD